MRLGVVLDPAAGLARLAAQAEAAEAAGLALGWIEGESSLLAAAAVAVRTSALRIAACVRADVHPLEIAEAAAVADNCSNGRLILVLEGDDPGETADAVLAALAPRPFRHRGPRWAIPANLADNEDHEERLVMRPPVAQTELPVWLKGRGGALAAARERGLAYVAVTGESPPPPAAARVRRPALLDVAAGDDPDTLVERLREAQRSWGLDTAILHLPAGLDPATLATHVAPRVTMHDLPRGLETHWRETLG